MSTLDPEDHIIIIAVGIVTGENEDSWGYVLDMLTRHADESLREWLHHKHMVAFHDRRAGLLIAINLRLPYSHSRCASYLSTQPSTLAPSPISISPPSLTPSYPPPHPTTTHCFTLFLLSYRFDPRHISGND